MPQISPSKFYVQYQGHPIEDLKTFHDITLQQRPDTPKIWLAGDSSLDNKYWVPGSGPGGDPLDVEIPEIYIHTLQRATPKPDVAFWINHVLGNRATCINTAVEASMLRERDKTLLPHDDLIRDHIGKEDVLIVSVGCNDIAMKPTFSTIWRMLALAWLTPRSSIDHGSAWSLGYFAHLFGSKTANYVERLCSRTKPRAVIICMIYFPLEAQYGQRGWGDKALKALGYGRDPRKLQAAIRAMFEMGTKKIKIEGTEVIPCKLYDVLDGSNRADYVERVEPSANGGRKMAGMFKILIDDVLKKVL
ncbi:hypothetical protein DPSP01_003809 [Paraphaeosphaeria sporulosa]|uniref:SGNH hydrolase n=1 Tax=Paraphaeosphaeria sporulosa TaxID=1460663 RepID=A0A177CTB1_9PLEO|nr:uncharacterized protein CC84DRAFT_1111831 [Paraphaeosphaeria sporulosa]OAG09989.1 hypothetical protein CC84DRAFT_1111831 [Paraphaeosphaeria sporulosa]